MNKSFLVPRVLDDDEDFPISPLDIDVSNTLNFVGAFDIPGLPDINTNYTNEKMNEGATIVVNACQKQGHWGPCDPFGLVYGHEEATFSLYTFLHNKQHQFSGMVVKGDNGLWRVTNAFIIYCYLAAPKKRKRQRALSSQQAFPSAVAEIESAT